MSIFSWSWNIKSSLTTDQDSVCCAWKSAEASKLWKIGFWTEMLTPGIWINSTLWTVQVPWAAFTRHIVPNSEAGKQQKIIPHTRKKILLSKLCAVSNRRKHVYFFLQFFPLNLFTWLVLSQDPTFFPHEISYVLCNF